MSSKVEPGQFPSVVCVVLNWNGWRDTVPCVHSLADQVYPALSVVVVDNASTDDSVERIREAIPGVDLVESGANRGFSFGCNVGVRLALERGADFIWLLNNDTIAPADTLTELVAAASDPQTGMVGSVLRYAHNPAEVQAWGGGSVARWSGYGTHFLAPSALGPNSYLTFASVLIRRALLEDVGLLDDGFFMYFEDSDLCFRALERGWKFAVAEETAVLHKEGGSQREGKHRARTDRIVTASGVRFLRRHGRPPFLAPWVFVFLRLAKRLVRADFHGLAAVLHGVKDWWNDNPLAFQDEA